MTTTLSDTKYPARITPVLITDEEHTISVGVPYSLYLKEKPSEDYSITISGYTEITSIPTSATNFYVDFARSIIYFHSSKAGTQVLVTYWGTGSPIIADDVNRFASLLDNLKSALFAFRVEALSGCRVRIYGGRFISGTTVYEKKELFMNFGVSGNFLINFVLTGFFKKILIGVNLDSNLIDIVEGAEAPTYDATVIPSFTSTFKPVAIVTVEESGGSVADITQSDIIVIRNCFI